MTPLEYLGAEPVGDGWRLRLPRTLHGAFGGVTGGALGAAAVGLSRTHGPDRPAVGVDIRFLRGLASRDATATVELLATGRTLTTVEVRLFDERSRCTTVATVSLADPDALEAIEAAMNESRSGHLDAETIAQAKPWRAPTGVEAPIIDTVRPRAARAGDGVATVVTVPWEPGDDGAEAICLAADLSVGPPVDGVLPRGTWVPHPNPDISIRFAGPVSGSELVAIATCRRVDRGVATVQSEIWDGDDLVGAAVSTSLFTRPRRSG